METAMQNTISQELICPIIGEIPDDPVMLQVDGRIYSKNALYKWFKTSLTSPFSRAPCNMSDIIESTTIRNMCLQAKNMDSSLPTSLLINNITKFEREPDWKAHKSISDTGFIDCQLVSWKDCESTEKLLFSISCINGPNTPTKPSDLCWSDIYVTIDNSYSTSNIVEARDQDGKPVESPYCINDLLRHTSKAVAASLQDTGSRVSFNTFDDKVEQITPLTEITSHNRDDIINQINKIKPRGGTNIWKGCRDGVKSLLTRRDKSRNPAILLLTDGQPNQGTNRPENEAITKIYNDPPKEWLQDTPPHDHLNEHVPYDMSEDKPYIPIYSIGFGYQLKKELMYNIARDTGGVNSSIPGGEMMVTVFSNAIANILNTRCYSTTLHISFYDPSSWKFGRSGHLDTIIDCDLPVSTILHDDGSFEIKILIGSLQFQKNRDIAINLSKKNKSDPDYRFNYWVTYYEGSTKYESNIAADTTPISNNPTYTVLPCNPEYEFLRHYACRQLKTMINDRNRGIDCSHRYQNLLNYIQKMSKEDQESNHVKYLQDTWTDQVRLGIVSMETQHADYWRRWGWIYIDQLSSALANQCSTNFKDVALEAFITPLTSSTSDRVSEIFDDLPNTPPTGKIRYSYSSSSANAPIHNVRVSDYNQSRFNTVCFTGSTLVEIDRTSLQSPPPPNSAKVTYCPISQLVPGDYISGGIFSKNGYFETFGKYKIIAIVETICDDNKAELVELFPNCYATSWHPIINYKHVNSNWAPACHFKKSDILPCQSVFSIVLEHGAMIKLPDQNNYHNYYAASLGHCNNAPGLYHPFWGSDKVIASIQKLPNYPYVKITSNMIHRNGTSHNWGKEVTDIF